MSHVHPVKDTDIHYKIDGITRNITNVNETKRTLVQNDHNSERLTFELPRFIDGHDVTDCNVVQVHFTNADTYEKNFSKGIYDVDDIGIKGESDADKNIAILTWLVSGKATKYVGTLNFVIRFSCVTDGVVEYAWNTAVFKGITILEGIYNSDDVVEEYTDSFEQFKKEVYDFIESTVGKPDLAENDETSVNFVKGRTHWEYLERPRESLLDETSISCLSVGKVSHSRCENGLSSPIIPGALYLVDFEGVRYDCLAEQCSDFILLGNGSIYDDKYIARKIKTSEGTGFTAANKLAANKLLGATPVTVEAWVNIPKDYSGRPGIIWGNFQPSGSYISFEVLQGGVPKLQRGFNDKDENAAKLEFTDVNLCTGKWTHVAITYEGNTGYCYVNGELKQTLVARNYNGTAADFNFAHYATTSNYPMVLGGDHRYPDTAKANEQYFKGKIASLTVYSDQRTGAEIKADMITPGKENLLVCYSLSDSTGTKVRDLSGNGYHIGSDTSGWEGVPIWPTDSVSKNEPFSIDYYPEGDCFYVNTLKSGVHTLAILSEEVVKVHKLDEKFIPDSVATKADIFAAMEARY